MVRIAETVAKCIENGSTLDEIPIEEYKEYSELFESDLYTEISLEACVAKRISKGSAGYSSQDEQFEYVEKFLK